jgi:hypothetical protein
MEYASESRDKFYSALFDPVRDVHRKFVLGKEAALKEAEGREGISREEVRMMAWELCKKKQMGIDRVEETNELGETVLMRAVIENPLLVPLVLRAGADVSCLILVLTHAQPLELCLREDASEARRAVTLYPKEHQTSCLCVCLCGCPAACCCTVSAVWTSRWRQLHFGRRSLGVACIT